MSLAIQPSRVPVDLKQSWVRPSKDYPCEDFMNQQIPRSIRSTVDPGDAAPLMLRRCKNCAALLAPQVGRCPSCRSLLLEWVPSSGEGTVVSWKVVYRPSPDTPLKEWTPSIIAIVELDDGPWVYTTIEGHISLACDAPVRVRFTPKPASDRFPIFTTCTVGGHESSQARLAEDRCAILPGALRRGFA